MSTAEDRKAAAAARQAKLLAKGKDRLAKITGAAKDEGRVLSDSATAPIKPVDQPAAVPLASANPPPPSTLAADDDPEEIDLATLNPTLTPQQHQAQQQLAALGFPADFGSNASGANPFAGFPAFDGANAPGMGPGGDDMFAQMMASMGGMGGAPGAEGASPFGPGGLGAMGGAGPGQAVAKRPKTLLDRVFPLVHLLSMVGLAWYAIAQFEPSSKASSFGWMGKGDGIDWVGWARLASGKQGAIATKTGEGLMVVPLLWLFVSVELVLQTTRLFLVRNKPSPPGILASVLPLLSTFAPKLGLIVNTATHYVSLAAICLNDFAVLVFCLGLFIQVAKYKVGDNIGPVESVVEAVDGAWNKVTGEL